MSLKEVKKIQDWHTKPMIPDSSPNHPHGCLSANQLSQPLMNILD